MRSLSVALVHYPVVARDASVVTTSVTNLDVHDIARSCYTYGVDQYFIVHPVAAQRQLVERITGHWTTGSGPKRIPTRRAPMERVRVVESLDDVAPHLDEKPEVWVTSAKPLSGALSHTQGRELLHGEGPPVLLVLGTGWGLANTVIESSDLSLAPINSPRADGYNHLSVRAAAAILLDRLLGEGA